MNQPPDLMRQLIPNIDELWDPRLPMSLNITRVVSGEAGPARQGQRQIQPQASGDQNDPQTEIAYAQGLEHETSPHFEPVRPGRATHSAQASPLLPRQGTTAEATSNQPDLDTTEYEDIIRALRKPTQCNLESPLLALQQQLINVFKHGPLRAGGVFVSMSAAAECGLIAAQIPDFDMPVPWNSCKAAATLVGLFACPPARVYEVLKFQSQRLNGLPTPDLIHNTSSTSLQTAFRHAKQLARGEKCTSSVIEVSLTDVHIFELATQGRSKSYTSFAHTFVLGIGPEGVIIWQGWGEHGYGLDQWVSDGRARLRTWQEAGDFVDMFEKFAAYKGKWDAKRNKLYKKLFDVDIFQTCGGQGPSRPIVPKVESWVRLLVMEDVKLDDIYKFTFE